MSDTKYEEKSKIDVAEPKRWKVLLLNDDHTPFDFVIALLMGVFNHTVESASIVTLQVHETGSGIAGFYDYEIAESKAIEATSLSRENNFPLQIKIEEE